MGRELRGIDEETDDDAVAERPPPCDQRQMAGMERAHGWHQRDALSALSPTRHPPAQRRRAPHHLKRADLFLCAGCHVALRSRAAAERRQGHSRTFSARDWAALAVPSCRAMVTPSPQQSEPAPVLLHLKTWQEVEAYLKSSTGIIVPIGST